MSDVLVKYQPRVMEYFDVRLDSEATFHLIATLKVAVKELEVHESMGKLLEALTGAYDQSADGIGSTDAAVDGDATAA